jgi:UDP-N-acetyl-2-amino-2-deoxyglucuronate dehydrogenase
MRLSLIDLKDEVEVAGCFSPSAQRRSAFAEAYGLPVADSLAEAIFGKTIDAVMVLTPPNSHLDLVRRAAAAGKHVLLEKPLEITFDRSRELVETAEQAGVRLGIVLQLRFRRTIDAVSGIISEGRLGEIFGVDAAQQLATAELL